jgi:hypothetical protein
MPVEEEEKTPSIEYSFKKRRVRKREKCISLSHFHTHTNKKNIHSVYGRIHLSIF